MKKAGFLLLFLFTLVRIQAQPCTEEQKISKLISYIRNLESAVFIRNGVEYSSIKAADHFQAKRKKAGTRIKTAREFISNLAAKSSTGEPYRIRFSNGKTFTTSEVLMKELGRIEAAAD